MVRHQDKSTVEVAPGIHRLGSGLTAYYLLEEGGRYTLVDGGFPRYYGQLVGFLAARGSTIEDVEAQVLTHHHPDHRGMTERIRRETGGPVWIHQADRPRLDDPPSPPRAPVWRPKVFRAVAHMIRHGIVKTPSVIEAATFGDGEILDVPGRPRVVHVPGHTPGNCALLPDEGSTVLTGDALITIDIYTWTTGPRIPAAFFNDDGEEALASLSNLMVVDAETILPGHGPIWPGPLDEAIQQARAVGVY